MPGSVVSPAHPRAAAAASSYKDTNAVPARLKISGRNVDPITNTMSLPRYAPLRRGGGCIHSAAGDERRAALTAPPIRTSSKQRRDYSSATPAFASRKVRLIKSVLLSRLRSPFAPYEGTDDASWPNITVGQSPAASGADRRRRASACARLI